MATATSTPEVLWAQRSNADEPEKNIVYLSINAYDCPESTIKLDIQPTKITFSGASKARTFSVVLEFYAEIDPSLSKHSHSARGVDFILRKKEAKQEFWPRLLKEPKKQHFLKTDFDKWVDEDEQEEEAPEDVMGGMGGPPGGDGGFGGMDFSKLGGMGGMGGMDMASMMGGGGEEDEDDEMPELEDSAPAKDGAKTDETPASASKIEEIN